MHSQNHAYQYFERASDADERFREYCALLMRDSLKGDDPKREQQPESAYDIKA